MLVHPYQGLFHDANLYALSALARLHPESLPQDVFLRFGSQDQFTLFSPVYAAAIKALGIDHAAALLTLLSQASLVLAGACLARAIMPARFALLGTALLLVLPGDYGPDRIFTCMEAFLTPRLAAQALTLAAAAAAYSGRKWCCLALMAGAAALHPVMAAAGAAMLLAAFVVLPRPRSGAWLLLAAGAWLLLAFYVLPAGTWGRLDGDWLALVHQRSPYLFLSYWQLDDWSRAAVTLASLLIGAFTLETNARLLCRATALTLLGGLALTWIACDLLHLTLFTQMQPWRWQWLATLAAALTLPLIVMSNWARGIAARSTALLLLGAWIFGVGEFALVAALCALLSLRLGHLQPRELRLMLAGSCALLGLALLWRIASNLQFTDVHYMDATLPLWLRRAASFAHDGLAPAALIGITAWTLGKHPAGAWRTSTVLGIAAILVLSPSAWQAWSHEEYPPLEAARYAPWQRIIAPGDEVFWGESPLSSWALLNRPNYLSGLQTSGMIFSRASALELQRRAVALGAAIGPATFLSWSYTGVHLSLSRAELQGVCRLAAFKYLITSAELDMQPLAVIQNMKLYGCAPQARAAAAAT